MLHARDERVIVFPLPKLPKRDPFPARSSFVRVTLCCVPSESAGLPLVLVAPMGLKLYCNRYAHFKDALVCSVNCVYRTRCREFALFYDEHRTKVDALVSDYYAARRESNETPTSSPSDTGGRSLPVVTNAVATPVELRALIRLEVLREMAEVMYIWIDKEDRAELLETEEVLKRAERGSKAKHIYRVAQEMELRFQLVPRKRIDKAKRAAAEDEQRAQARRARNARSQDPAPVPFPAPAPVVEEPAAEPAPRRAAARTRAVKVAGDR